MSADKVVRLIPKSKRAAGLTPEIEQIMQQTCDEARAAVGTAHAVFVLVVDEKDNLVGSWLADGSRNVAMLVAALERVKHKILADAI